MTPILVTGGAGYVGSHTVKLLRKEGFEPIVYDNFCRGHRDFVKWGPVIEGDIRDRTLMREALRWAKPAAVIHFAAYAYVGESVDEPGLYYDNNVGGTLALLEAMREAGAGNLIVSSTCATYGQPDAMPIAEDAPQRPINPYGDSKLMMERMCQAFGAAHGLKHVSLRYFNACGADLDGDIGERHDPEPHLIPRLLMAASGETSPIQVFGDDYATPDGTCIRDYIHVSDLARAHVAAARHLIEGGGSDVFNLGTGRGSSVSEVLAAAGRAVGREVPCVIGPRRPGDPPELVADPAKARRVLGWQVGNSDLGTILDTAWAWHRKDRENRRAA
jgi:UDP-arabinose 4-epimerase